MKVIFIGTNMPWGDGIKDLTEGGSYEVMKERTDRGEPYYQLSINTEFAYHQSGFAPTSEIDEMELTKERQNELV